MSFFDLFKRNTAKKETDKSELIQLMDELGVLYEESDGGVVTCLDHNGSAAVSFTKAEDVYHKDDSSDPWTLDGVRNFLEEFLQKDKTLTKFEGSEFYAPFNTLYQDLSKLIKASGKTPALDVKNNTVRIVENYKSKDGKSMFNVIASVNVNDGTTYSYPSGKQRTLQEIFASGASMIYKENKNAFPSNFNPFLSADYQELWKRISLSIPITDRLNDISGVEAKAYEDGTTLFIMFENGAAIEYTPPSKNEKAKVLILEYDNEHKINKNLSYASVLDVLRIPENAMTAEKER